MKIGDEEVEQTMYFYFKEFLMTCRNLGGKNTVAMNAGDRVVICTPGGGGYGLLEEMEETKWNARRKTHARDQWRGTGSVANYQSVQESA